LITINLLEQLKSETLSNHQQLEKNLIVKLKGMRSPEDYISILQNFYAYFGGLEDQINHFIGDDELPDYAERRKTRSIKDDILALGGVVPEKASTDDLPEIGNLLQAFGALYVIEGSTLGGQVISKMISKQLSLDGEGGVSFFESYGADTMTMWNKFKAVLEHHAATQEDAGVITGAANETFARFRLWMERN
jgi:heme oxygenase